MANKSPERRRPAAAEQNQFDEIEELFDQTDEDSDSVINFLEFKSLMEDLDADMSPQTLEIGFKEIDTDGDGQISFGEFRAWWGAN